MNQPEAAEALGCSMSTVSRIVSGDRTPSVDLMKEIRRVFSWGLEAQVEAIDSGEYAELFKTKMERRRMRQRLRRPRGRVVDA